MADLRESSEKAMLAANTNSDLVTAALDLKEKVDGSGKDTAGPEDGVAELLGRLNLTSEEASAVILDDENEEDLVSLDWALICKVLSPNILHIQTIMSALRPAWGNPRGLSAKPVGDNTFIVEFANKEDLDRVVAGAPWTVGKHAVLLATLIQDTEAFSSHF